MNQRYAVIMAGGSGTRFWPLSRESTPKQLLRIGSDETLIQTTVRRILPLVPRERIYIVTNRSQSEDIRVQLEQRYGGSWTENFILEPMARNTAPALGLSALRVEALDPDGIMIVLAADHVIRREEAFLEVLERACAAAERDYLVTLGIVPLRPETGYGYIKAGRELNEPGLNSVHGVEAFVEKPDLRRAQLYLDDDTYFWNSGMFVWKTAVFLKELERLHPRLFESLSRIKRAKSTESELRITAEVFADLQPISVDYAVMEKTDRAAVAPANIGWSDVGSWGAVFEIMDRDPAGNVITGNVIDLKCENSVIRSEGRLVAAVGVRDMVVADTADALLVCGLSHVQEIKSVVDELRRRGAEEYRVHKTVYRPWGSFTVLANGPHYKVKCIEVNPGSRLSLQLHEKRSEQWVVVQGTARVVNGDREADLSEGEGTFIPVGARHRLENRTEKPLALIEVQTGEYVGEDDITRLQDDYHRI